MESLMKALERGLDKIPDEWNESVLHVSDLAVALDGDDGACGRALYLRLRGADKEPNTSGKKLMFHFGHRIHAELPGLLELPEGVECVGIEQPVSLYKEITGRYDMMLKDGGGTTIVDFKTVRGNAFNYLDGPKPSHVLQVQGYIEATGADAGHILYVDREGQNFAKEFEVEPDHDAVNAAAWVLLDIRDSVKGPPKLMDPKIKLSPKKTQTSIYIKSPWQCDYCPYRDVSCPGAVPRDLRTSGVCGKYKDGELILNGDYPEDIVMQIEKLLDEEVE